MAKEKRRRGRPPIIQNKEKIDKIIEYIGDGYYIETAAALAGISKQTLYNWLRLANEARGKEKKNTLETQMVEFADRVEVARAQAEKDLIDKIDRSVKWEAAAWRLSKLFPDRYTDKKIVEGEFKGEVTETHKLSETQLKELGDALARNAGDLPQS